MVKDGLIPHRRKRSVRRSILFDKKVDTAALFFVSLEIMSQRCFAFVGNFDSEVSEMAYQRLCLNRRTACHAISMGKNGGEPEENGGEPEENGGEPEEDGGE